MKWKNVYLLSEYDFYFIEWSPKMYISIKKKSQIHSKNWIFFIIYKI